MTLNALVAARKSTMDGSQVLRPAGLLERYHITRCDLGLDSCVVTSAQYSCRLGLHALNNARVRNALAQMVRVHPALSVQVFGESVGKPVFVRLRTIDLSQVIEEIDDALTLQDVMAYHLSRPFEIGCFRPLWRASVLKNGTVVFAFHHAIADGQSCLALHKAFLKALNDLPADLLEPPTSITIDPLRPFLPPVDQLANISVPLRKLCHEVYNLFAPASWKDGSHAWTGNHVLQSPTLAMSSRLWELAAYDAKKLVVLCRSYGCTLTAFLHVLFANILSYIVTSQASIISQEHKKLSVNIAVSLRRFTGTLSDEICDQSSKYHLYTPIISVLTRDNIEPSAYPDFPWDRAAEFSRTLHKELPVVLQDIGAMGYLFGHFREYFTGMLDKKREGTYTISNIGRFTFDDTASVGGSQGDWSIRSMFFAQCDATCGTALKINVVGSPDGSIGTTFTWGEGTVQDDIAETFVRMVQEWAMDVLTRSTTTS